MRLDGTGALTVIGTITVRTGIEDTGTTVAGIIDRLSSRGRVPHLTIKANSLASGHTDAKIFRQLHAYGVPEPTNSALTVSNFVTCPTAGSLLTT